ncbi:MAG: HlyD family efflux transporter periplasmic adaptor subunit [Verrucomicrobiaceae bacterium]|nr:HlyD family efflux transporter periplasmic adaptor subunit [Verrucomicrobiaceae bacterium]
MPAAATDRPSTTTPPWEARRPPARRGLLRKMLIMLLIAGGIGFLASALRPRPIQVETALVQDGPLTVFVSEEGRTRIRNRHIVAAPVAGSMQRVTLKPGDTVQAGKTILTRIQPAQPALLDDRTRATATAQVASADAARKRAQEALEASRTTHKFAQSNWDRVQRTTEKGTLSDTDRDEFHRLAEISQREVRAAEFALQAAESDHTQAQAALLQFTTHDPHPPILEIKAPVSGVVLRVQQESATIITPGTAILEIGDPTDLEVEAEILTRDAVGILPGATVSIEQWGGPEPLPGRVRRIEPAAFTKVSALGVEEQRVLVLSDFSPPHQTTATQPLGDRYRVEVRVAVWSTPRTLLVPSGALFREGSQWKTFILAADKAQSIIVEAGRSDGRHTQVLSGLQSGDRVLMHPPDSVKHGSAVVPREAP